MTSHRRRQTRVRQRQQKWSSGSDNAGDSGDNVRLDSKDEKMQYSLRDLQRHFSPPSTFASFATAICATAIATATEEICMLSSSPNVAGGSGTLSSKFGDTTSGGTMTTRVMPPSCGASATRHAAISGGCARGFQGQVAQPASRPGGARRAPHAIGMLKRWI